MYLVVTYGRQQRFTCVTMAHAEHPPRTEKTKETQIHTNRENKILRFVFRLRIIRQEDDIKLKISVHLFN